jgi:hypothetical protein
VEVPYSWNGDLKNLASSIRLIRPDLLLDTDILFLEESTENEQYNGKLSEANPLLSGTTRKESILSSGTILLHGNSTIVSLLSLTILVLSEFRLHA